MANIWVEELGLIVDDQTGNTYDPDEGFWRSPDRRRVFGGPFGEFWQDAPGGYISPASSAVTGFQALSVLSQQGVDQAGANAGAFTQIPGYGFELQSREFGQEKLIQELLGQQNREIAEINNAAALARTQLGLTQSEAEFVRSIALQERTQKFAEEIGRAQLELDRSRAAREERMTAAQLASNPADWITYQEYVRRLPREVALANEAAGLPGAASESQIQSTAQGLFNPGATLYNPNIKGTGAFGTKIEAPNTISRSELYNLSPSQELMLEGLLRAGVETSPGKRTSIDPSDYMGQVNRSLIPTLSSVGGSTQYR